MYFATHHSFRHQANIARAPSDLICIIYCKYNRSSSSAPEYGSIMAISVAVLPANHTQADMATDHMMCKLCCQQLYQLCSGANQNTASLKY